MLQKKQVQALKTKPEPEKPMIPKRSGKDARDAREVARKLIKSGNINIKKPDQFQVQFKRPKGQEKKKTLPEPTSYHPFSTSSSIEDDSSSSKSPLPTEKADGWVSLVHRLSRLAWLNYIFQQSFDLLLIPAIWKREGWWQEASSQLKKWKQTQNGLHNLCFGKNHHRRFFKKTFQRVRKYCQRFNGNRERARFCDIF